LEIVVDFFQSHLKWAWFLAMCWRWMNAVKRSIPYDMRFHLEDLMEFRIIGQPAVFFRRGCWKNRVSWTCPITICSTISSGFAWQALPPCGISPVLAAARFHAGAKNVAAAEQFGQEAYRMVEWMRRYEKTSTSAGN
jgi:hypothetical protein